MAARSNGRPSIRGRGDDLRAEPGEGVIDRLLGDPEPHVDMSTNRHGAQETSRGSASATRRQGAKELPPESAARGDRVKVSFYLRGDQRDELEKSLVEARRWVAKMEGRRLDQSALVRAVLSGVISDYQKHAGKEADSLLVQWLQSYASLKPE